MTATPSFVDAAATHARLRPDAPAILEGAILWSWAELDRKADALAAGLAAAGIVPGNRVGLISVSSAATVAALHGLARAGAVAVAIGPRLTRTEIAGIAAAARLGAIVGPRAGRQVIDGGDPGVAALDIEDLLELGARPIFRRAVWPRLPAVIVPTSGSTGLPKLVRLGAAQLDASAAAWSAVLPPATGWLLSLNLAHVSGIGIVVRAARAGVPVVVPAGTRGAPLGPSLAAARAVGISVSHLSLVPAQLSGLLEAAGGDAAPPPTGVRAILLGGGPIPESLVARAVAGGWPIVPSYGMTETASGVVAVPLGEAGRHLWSAGRPLPGVELRIEPGAARQSAADRGCGSVTGDPDPGRDPAAGDPSTRGEDTRDSAPGGGAPGEILIRGPMVFDGYENDPEASAAALDADGWLHTGDLGVLDSEGWLRVIGRLDEIIISGGENIAPAEIEAVLTSHPAVADVGVIGVSDAKWGSVPVAIVAFHPGRHEDAEALRLFVRERLSAFKVPARVVEVASIPRSPGGKQLRQSLAALASAGVPRHSLAGTTRVEAGDGQQLGFRELSGPPGAPTIVLLHATLSTSRQLLRLAGRLRADYRVLLPDRRGSGTSPMSNPGPVSIARHVDDILAVLDAAGAERPAFFGHSFGALLTLEFAARHPDRVAAVVAYEPPYLAVSPTVLARFAGVGEAVGAAYSAGGPAASAQFFVRTVAGDDAWERLGPAQQALLEVEGSGALADAAMPDLDPAGLARIGCPVVIATGDNSDDYYAPIADALAIVIRDAHRVRLPGLRHTAPITDPAPIAELIRKSKPGH